MDKLTIKQENFCINLFQGMSQREAYVEAGYSRKQTDRTIDRHAWELAQTDIVMARCEELRQKAENGSVALVLERKQILTEIARARLTDYTTCGPDRDLIDVGPESPNTASLQEITSKTEYDKDGAGVAVVTRIKLHNPIQAIDILNKMDKIYNDGHTTLIDNRSVNIEGAIIGYNAREYSDEELLAIIKGGGGRGISKSAKCQK